MAIEPAKLSPKVNDGDAITPQSMYTNTCRTAPYSFNNLKN